MTQILISAAFDAGNIETIQADSAQNIRLKIKEDPYTVGTDERAHFQWFYFQVAGGKDQSLKISIENAGQASYAPAWKGYDTVYSYDRKNWLRVPDCSYDEDKGHLKWTLACQENLVWFAYFAPYSYEQHLALVAKAQGAPDAKVSSLGLTLDGRSLNLIEVGKGHIKLWIAGRQHPGESMAEWFIEGLLERLLHNPDAVAKKLKEQATIRVIPNMNPDGSVRGHLRTNASGANLNREWANTGGYQAPTMERSPEVYHVLRELDRVGCDFYLDVHGDEEIPANFLVGNEGIPNYSQRQHSLYLRFSEELLAVSKDFQAEMGYPIDGPGEGNLARCSDQVAHRFNCLALTLEQPFKDTWNNPDKERGWSPERAMNFGAQTLDAISSFFAKGF